MKELKKRINKFLTGAIVGLFLAGLIVFAGPGNAQAQTSPFSQWMYARYGRNHYKRSGRSRASGRRTKRHTRRSHR